MQQPPNMMHHQQPQQQLPLPKKRKQAGGGSVPVGSMQHMTPGIPGVNSAVAQGMHPAMAQQMLLKKMPEPEDPTIAEMEELNARDMAVARYRRRHVWMNEVFSPISLADMPPPPNPYDGVDVQALEDQVVQLERQAADTEKHGHHRLEETKARFAGIEQEVTDQHASMQPDP